MPLRRAGSWFTFREGCSACALFMPFGKALWLLANRDRGLALDAPVEALDRELDRERLGVDGQQRTFSAELGSLPDGVLIRLPGAAEAWLLGCGSLWPWSPEGYGASAPRPDPVTVTVLTPRSTVATVAAGYVPVVHPSCRREARGARP